MAFHYFGEGVKTGLELYLVDLIESFDKKSR